MVTSNHGIGSGWGGGRSGDCFASSCCGVVVVVVVAAFFSGSCAFFFFFRFLSCFFCFSPFRLLCLHLLLVDPGGAIW